MNFPQRLKELREEKKLKQTELASELHISQPRIQEWETGKRNPNQKSLINISQFFNVSTSYLLGETNIRNSNNLNDIVEQISYLNQEKTIEYATMRLEEQSEDNKINQFNTSLRSYHVIEQALSAGTGFGYTDDVSYSTVYWHEDLEYDLATWISGNSMEPDFHNGDVALIKKQYQVDYEGQVCAVDWDGNSYIKKIFIEDDGLVLRSINPIYDDKFASWDEQPRIIGIVTAHVKPEQKK